MVCVRPARGDGWRGEQRVTGGRFSKQSLARTRSALNTGYCKKAGRKTERLEGKPSCLKPPEVRADG